MIWIYALSVWLPLRSVSTDTRAEVVKQLVGKYVKATFALPELTAFYWYASLQFQRRAANEPHCCPCWRARFCTAFIN